MGAEPIARAWWWLVAVSTLLLVGVTLSRAHLPADVAPGVDDAVDDVASPGDAAPDPDVAGTPAPNPSDPPPGEVVPSDPIVAAAGEAQHDAAGSGEGAPDVEGSGSPADDGADEAAAPAPVREGTDAEPCAFRLNRATVARNVEHREPVDADGPFPADGTPLFVFIDADNRGEDASDHATVRWVHRATGGVWSNRARLGRNHRWRTWVDRVLPATRVGAWQAQVIDDDGCLLTTLDFEVIPHGW